MLVTVYLFEGLVTGAELLLCLRDGGPELARTGLLMRTSKKTFFSHHTAALITFNNNYTITQYTQYTIYTMYTYTIT